MATSKYDLAVILGTTASGKTRLAVQLARELHAEIISADSRQVYRGLDIGSGKDLSEYTVEGERVPHHLIDIVDLDQEFSVYDYHKHCLRALEDVRGRGRLPILVGGTGLYIDAIIEDYAMVDVKEDPELRARLDTLPQDALSEELRALKPDLHNTTDLNDRGRLIRAIEIATHSKETSSPSQEKISAFVMGMRWPRPELHRRIARRLTERMEGGLIEEVENLLAQDISQERLRLLGLEYRYVAEFVAGEIKNRNDLFQKLSAAIRRFAKRQETWFRRMERRGVTIHWLEGASADQARDLLHQAFPVLVSRD